MYFPKYFVGRCGVDYAVHTANLIGYKYSKLVSAISIENSGGGCQNPHCFHVLPEDLRKLSINRFFKKHKHVKKLQYRLVFARLVFTSLRLHLKKISSVFPIAIHANPTRIVLFWQPPPESSIMTRVFTTNQLRRMNRIIHTASSHEIFRQLHCVFCSFCQP